MPTVRIPGRSRGGPLRGYLAEPVATSGRGGPWPGVVVVHDAFGLGDDMREQADWLAAAGYLAVLPDLYTRGGRIRCVQATFRALMAGHGPAFDDIEVTRRWLAERSDCTGVTGVIGYCMGGGFALLVAARPGWSAASVNYGPLLGDVEEVLQHACPVVASYGGRDRSLRGSAQRLERVLTAADVPHDVKEYPRARHCFLNRITAMSPLTVPLKVLGVGYDHDSAADAKRRILAFFDTHLHRSA